MSVFFSITKSEEFVGATILVDGTPYPVASDHPKYEEITDILLHGNPEDDLPYFLSIINPVQAVSTELVRVSERVTIGGNVLYFDGEPIDTALADHIVAVFRDEDEEKQKGFTHFVAFLEKLFTNPSEVSKNHLFDFVQHHGITITEEGDLLLYKSTKHDGLATHQGYGIVTDDEGKITVYEHDYLPNAVGFTVEIPRGMVDENRNASCSVGLHVGAFSYASSYSQRLWNVLVNPRDVVSVPHDAGSAKIRVARYRVLGENALKQKYQGHSIDLRVQDQPGLAEPELEVEEEVTEVGLESPQTILGVVRPDVQPVAVTPADNGSRVPEYEQVIKALIAADPKANLKRYRSKRITAGRRDEFTKAAENLGYKL